MLNLFRSTIQFSYLTTVVQELPHPIVEYEHLDHRDLKHEYKLLSSSHPDVPAVPVPSGYHTHSVTDESQSCGGFGNQHTS